MPFPETSLWGDWVEAVSGKAHPLPGSQDGWLSEHVPWMIPAMTKLVTLFLCPMYAYSYSC